MTPIYLDTTENNATRRNYPSAICVSSRLINLIKLIILYCRDTSIFNWSSSYLNKKELL